ncbi:MAG: hypothetical protein Q9163_006388, partial [Psora crenata]
LRSNLMKDFKPAEFNLPLRPSKNDSRHMQLRLEDSQWKPEKQDIATWHSNILTFWTSHNLTVKFQDGRLASIYDSTQALQARQGQDELRYRFLTVFFYDLPVFIYPQSAISAQRDDCEAVARIISRSASSGQSIGDIVSQVQGWVKKGRRYDLLTTSFGNGILLELPVEGCRDNLEKRMPIRDKRAYRAAVKDFKKFKERADENDSHALGTDIRKGALEPFRFLREDPTFKNRKQPSTVMKRRRAGASNHSRRAPAATGQRRTSQDELTAPPQGLPAGRQQSSHTPYTNQVICTTEVNEAQPPREELDAIMPLKEIMILHQCYEFRNPYESIQAPGFQVPDPSIQALGFQNPNPDPSIQAPQELRNPYLSMQVPGFQNPDPSIQAPGFQNPDTSMQALQELQNPYLSIQATQPFGNPSPRFPIPQLFGDQHNSGMLQNLHRMQQPQGLSEPQLGASHALGTRMYLQAVSHLT